jgi:tetratricopeptide (TPR) repeat protein
MIPFKTNIFPFFLFILLGIQTFMFSQNNAESFKTEALKQMKVGRYGEAIDLINKFITAKPTVAEGYNIRGLSYEKRNQLELAVYDFRNARKLAPNDKEINDNLARATKTWYDQLYQKIDGHRREIAIDPSRPVNYLEIGKCYKNLGQWAVAEEWYDEYIKREEPSSDEVIRYRYSKSTSRSFLTIIGFGAVTDILHYGSEKLKLQ